MTARPGEKYAVVLTVVDVGPAYLGSTSLSALCTFVAPNGETVTLNIDPRFLGGAS